MFKGCIDNFYVKFHQVMGTKNSYNWIVLYHDIVELRILNLN